MSLSLSDMLVTPVWLTANALAFRAAWRVGRTLFPSDTLLRQVVHLIVLWYAGIVGAALTLGAMGCLSAPALVALVAGGAGMVLWRLRRAPAAKRISAEKPWAVAWGIGLTLCLGHVVVGGLLEFPTDWDSLMYHIPLVDQWLQAQSLYAPDSFVWYNAGNNELVELWMVAPFSGDFLVSLANLPAVSLLALGTVELARQLQLRAATCHLAGLTVTANYVVLRQALDSENDLAVAALFVAGLAYAFRYAREGRAGALALAAGALGLLAGVKYYALGYAGLAGLALVSLAWASRGRRDALRAAGAALAGVAAWSGYWYLRNAWVTGAPLFPRGFSPSDDLFAQILPNAWHTTLLGNGSPRVPPLLIETVWQSLGVAHLAACAMAPTAVAWLCLTGILRARRAGRIAAAAPRLTLGLLVVGSALVLGVTPYAVESEPGTMNMLKGAYLPARFGLCFLTLAVLACLVLLDDLHVALLAHLGAPPAKGAPRALRWQAATWSCRLPHLAFVIAALTQLLPTHFRSLPGSTLEGVLVGVNLALAAVCAWESGGLWNIPWNARVVALTAMLIASLVNGWLGERWHNGFAPHFDRFFQTDVFTRLSRQWPDGSCICAAKYRIYPFFGSRRQFRVSQPLWVPTSEAFLDYVDNRGATVVVTLNHDWRVNGLYRETKKWLDAEPGRFTLLRADGVFSTYRVRPLVAGTPKGEETNVPRRVAGRQRRMTSEEEP